MVSELFEHVGGVVDDFCFLHTVHGDSAGHSAATLGMHTGSVTIPLPSLGSWVSYGLGTLNTNLPSFVVLAAKEPYNGYQVWDSNFLPAYHKGVRVIPGPDPLPDVKSPVASVTRRELEGRMLRDLNEAHLSARDGDEALAVADGHVRHRLRPDARGPRGVRHRPRAAPHPRPLRRDAGDPGSFAAQCLIARRLIERGVRVVELFDVGSNTNWDSHNNIDDHRALSRNVDRPIAALVTDLKQRGLLDETLIVGCSEFGRTPWQDLTPRGRGHHSRCFTCFLAGGGVKAGLQLRRLRRLRRRPGREPRPRPRLPRHHPPPDGPGPHPAHLPLLGPRLPPHRRPRQGRPRSDRVRLYGYRRSVASHTNVVPFTELDYSWLKAVSGYSPCTSHPLRYCRRTN